MDALQKYYDKQVKSLKDYYTGKGLYKSSFHQKPYDALTKEYEDLRQYLSQRALRSHNERINAQAGGELPEQVMQRRGFDEGYDDLLEAQEARRKQQEASRLAGVQPSQILNGQLIGGQTQGASVKVYNDASPWIFKYIPAGETIPKGWH